MRQTLSVLVIIVALVGSASAQYLGQMCPAGVLPTATGKMGGYLIVAEHATAIAGSLRYGFNDYLEGRARLGFIDPSGGDIGLIFGADLKYLLWKYNQSENPVDLSLGGMLEYADPGHGNLLGLGGSIIGSMPFQLENNRRIEPYARLGLRIQRESVDDVSDSHLKIGLNVGALFSITPLIDFTVELQADDEMAVMAGVDLVAF